MSGGRLERSQDNRMLGGVCGGLGEYLGIDATFVRLFFLLLVFGEGAGVLIYFVLWLILPPEESPASSLGSNVNRGAQEISERAREIGRSLRQGPSASNQQVSLIVGGALVIVGVIYLIDNLNLAWLGWLRFNVLWPAMLIVGGAFLLVRYLRGE
ncbi:MAG: PspC domain-containing protein [Anaerolineales bacterium]|jgi:phage shock protein C